MTRNIKNSIIKTLIFYELFKTPLTKRELLKLIWQPPHGALIAHIENSLDELLKEDIIKEKNGLIYLPSGDENVHIRTHGYVTNLHKLRIAKRACQKIRYVPFVEAVFVCNNMTVGSAKVGSDIDVFIIVKSGHIWLTRALTTTILHIFRLRRHNKKITDRICLSFFTADDALNFENISIHPEDIYLAYWLALLYPIYDPNAYHSKILSQNYWIKDLIPNALQPTEPVDYLRVTDNRLARGIKYFFTKAWGGAYGNLLEKEAKKIQLAKMKMNTKSIQDESNNKVIINDKMLKFHENDRREYYHNQWQEQVAKIIK